MISVELLCRDNLDEVYELEKLCFPSDPWEYAAFESELSNEISVYIVAKDEESGAVCGYAGVWMMYDVGNITNVAVHPAFRRGGIGMKLIELIEKICSERGMREITLEVRAGNKPAIALYEKMGFKLCGLRKRYYKNREDALIMTKEAELNADSGN